MISSTQQHRERPKKSSQHSGKSRYCHFYSQNSTIVISKISKILGFKKGGIPGNPEFRNSGITITNSNNAVF